MNNAPGSEEREGASAGGHERKTTKIQTIAEALIGGSLNRFEAERHGDHCLNSTVAEIRGRGVVVLGRWEEVPNRFGTTTRVQRYSIPPSEAAKVQRLSRRRAVNTSAGEGR